jgi:DNA-binding MarR family transcriptional regulator
MKNVDGGRQVLELLRELQRSNGAIGKLYGEDLTIGDGHVIIELTANPYATTVELAAIVGLDQSSISRLLARLIKKKIIVKKRIEGKRGHILTAYGRTVLAKMNRGADTINSARLKNIPSKDHDWFFGTFDRICSMAGATVSARQKDEHVFRSIQRRVARALGMVQGIVSGSDLATSHWHILSEMIRFSDPIDLDRLIERLNIERAILVAALHALRLRKLIKSDASGLDSRKTLYSITESGQKHLKTSLHPLESRLEKSLSELGEREAVRFLTMLSRFIEYTPADEAISSLVDYQFTLVTAAAERNKIRAAYVTWVVNARTLSEVPSRLFGDEELTFALYSENGKLVACAQAEPREDGVILNAIGADPALPTEVRKLFVTRCRGQLPKESL